MCARILALRTSELASFADESVLHCGFAPIRMSFINSHIARNVCSNYILRFAVKVKFADLMFAVY